MSFSFIRYYGYVLLSLCKEEGISNTIIKNGESIRLNFDGLLINYLNNGARPYLVLLTIIFVAVVGYLLGSINFAIVLSKVFHHDDIRNYGSKNAGATNMLRIYGKKAGIATFVLDAIKGAVAAMLGMMLIGEGGGYIAGLFCILGHIFPIYYHFKGGKGVVVSIVTILCLNPLVAGIILLIFIIIVATSKYISLGSIISAFFYPLVLNAFNTSHGFISTVVSVLIAVIVIVMHKSNIKRLMNRTENKFSFNKKAE